MAGRATAFSRQPIAAPRALLMFEFLDGDGQVEATVPDSGTGVERPWMLKFAVCALDAPQRTRDWKTTSGTEWARRDSLVRTEWAGITSPFFLRHGESTQQPI